MAFSGGVFSLIAGNPVTTNTTISSTWANNTLDDIADNGLSLCLLKDGTQTATAAVPFAAGINVTSTAGTFYVSSTFTMTFTTSYFTVAQTATVRYSKNGNMVTLTSAADVAGTSNATTKISDACVPSALRPSVRVYTNGFISSDNSGAAVAAAGFVDTDGTIRMYADCAETAWTASGTATIKKFSISYSI